MQTLDTTTIVVKRRSVSVIMLHVIVALLPGISLYALIIDSRILLNIVIVTVCALICEAVLVLLRQRAVLPVLKDASVVLAALLFVLSVPQSLPVWQLVFGILILCTLGKHVFGGLGHNPFNPAMVAYAVMIVSFPLTMTQWTSDNGLLDSEPVSMSHKAASSDGAQIVNWDSLSGATPLDRLDALQREAEQAFEHTGGADEVTTVTVSPTQMIMESDWLWINLAWLAGGLYLLYMRVISWRIPVSVLSTLGTLYFFFDLTTATPVLPAHIALFSGAIMLGAFFIATDPVSAATSDPGKLVYGAGIGLLCFVIREFSVYPEGIAFAVLLMNMCVPLIDHAFTRNSLLDGRISDKKLSDEKSDRPHS